VKYVLCFLILCATFNCSAQQQLTLVDDYCYDDSIEIGGALKMKPLIDGSGYVVVGYSRLEFTGSVQHHGTFNSGWNKDAYIGILNNDFSVRKENVYGGTITGDDDDEFADVIEQSDGSFVCFGETKTPDGDFQSLAAQSFALFKVDSNLNKVWSKPYGCTLSGITDQNFVQSVDGGFIMAGMNNGPCGDGLTDYDGSIFKEDWLLVKTDSAGNKVWAKVFGSSGDERDVRVMEDVAGDIYLYGSSGEGDFDMISDTSWKNTTATGGDIFLMKLNSYGNKIWTKSYGGTGYEYIDAGFYDSFNNCLVIAGGTSSKDLMFSDAQHQGDDAFFMRLDTSGNLLQTKLVGGKGMDFVRDIFYGTSQSEYFLFLQTQSNNNGDMAGYTLNVANQIGAGGLDLFLCTIDFQGDFSMKYGIHNSTFDNRPIYSSYSNQTKEVLLHVGLAQDAFNLCDTSYLHTNSIKKPIIRRLVFEPLSFPEITKPNRSITIYPNPASNSISFTLPENFDKVNYQIKDYSGKLIQEGVYEEGGMVE